MSGAKGARGVLAALVLVLALTGCSSRGGVAAVADGRQIPVSDLQRAVTELGPIYQGATIETVLTAMIVGPTFSAVAVEHGLGVSDEQAAASLVQAYQGQHLDPPDSFGTGALDVAKFSLAVDALGNTADGDAMLADAEARVQKLEVDVSPRYGELDMSAGTVTPSTYPWLVADATATP